MNRLVRTEMLKQRTTRTLLGGIATAPIVAGLVTIAILDAAGKHGNDPLSADNLVQVLGAPASAITLIAILLGVFGTTGEYRHQTITTTFLASPRRRDVVIAKLAAYSITGAEMAVLSLTVSTAIAVPWLHSSGVDIHVGGDTIRVAAALVVSTALHAALGVSIGALIRNQTAAATAVVAWMLAAEGLIGDLLGRHDFARWFPAAAGRALVHVGPTGDNLSSPVAAAAFSAYVVVLAAAGTRITIRRDIT